MRRSLVVILLFGLLVLGASCNQFRESRGRGDAPVRVRDDSPKEVIQMPDQFSNIAHACDGHGHRVFVTTQNNAGKAMFVVADSSCAGGSGDAR